MLSFKVVELLYLEYLKNFKTITRCSMKGATGVGENLSPKFETSTLSANRLAAR